VSIENEDIRVDERFLEDIKSESHPSRFETEGEVSVLIIRIPSLEGDRNIVSYSFLIEGERCYMYDHRSERFKEIGTLSDLHRFLHGRVSRLLKYIQQVHYDIEALEEHLYDEGVGSEFMQVWLEHKKGVSLVHRLMFHAVLAMELFIGHFKRREDLDDLDYADLLEHMNRIKDLSYSALQKLDNLYDFYRAKVDERINKNMYLLTVISAIFLPMTLVTGFFGMNTGGLPLTDDPDGTIKAVVITLLLEALFLIPFLLLRKKGFKRYGGGRSDT